jgi:hypothetical protein
MQSTVLLLMWADLERYPPTLNAASCLAEAGRKITLVTRASDDAVRCNRNMQGVEIQKVEYNSSSKLTRMIGLVRFLIWSIRTTRRIKPCAVVAYDNFALIAGRLAKVVHPDVRLVYHSHDVQPSGAPLSLGGIAWRLERRLVRSAAIVVLPDAYRASAYARAMQLKQPVMVVPNAPRLRTSSASPGALQSLLPEVAGKTIVIRHGSIGPGHALESTVRSMRAWPPDTCLVLVGKAQPIYRAALQRLALETGAEGRLFMLPLVTYPEVLDLVADADVGLALYDGPLQRSDWAFAGTASNKALEYLAAGIPFLVDDHPASAVFVREGVALSADPRNEHEIASSITKLCAGAVREKMRWKAIELHRSRLHFEQGFAKLAAALGMPAPAEVLKG